jgi:hypothetical protein
VCCLKTLSITGAFGTKIQTVRIPLIPPQLLLQPPPRLPFLLTFLLLLVGAVVETHGVEQEERGVIEPRREQAVVGPLLSQQYQP